MNFGKFKKRVLTFLLAFAIMLSFVPAGLAAAENSPVDENDTNLEYLRDLIDAATETIVQASADLVIDGYRYPVSIELPLGVSTTATGVTPIAHAAASGNIHWYVNQWWMQNAQHSPIPTRPQINAANFLVVEYPTPPAAGTQLVLSLSATGGWNHTHAQAMALPAEHRVVVVADGETTQFVFDLRAPFTKAVQTGANAFNPNATEFGMTVNTQGAAHGPATRAYFANNRVEDDGGGNGNGGDIEYSDHALRPFPQAGLGTGVVVDLYTPTGLTQEDMNHAVLRQFARIIQGAPQSIAPGVAAHPAVYFFEEITSQFVVDPASVRDDPDNFRMAMFIAHGTGGWGTGARSLRLTVCEAMGYGMLMLVKMSGSEDIPFEFNGSTTTIRNLLFNALPTELQDHFCIGEVDTKLFFDAMFRSLRHWPTHPIHVTGGHHQTGAVVTNNSYRGNVPNNFRPAYTMAWSLHYNTDIQGFIRETGPSNATDGAMDMAYAIILAGEQWGDDPVWCPTTPDGKVYSYSEWARRMVNDLWLMNVHRSFGQSGGGTGVNATAPARTGGGNYHITIGNWVNNNQGANSRTSRPSDHILHHLKAFLEVNPQNDWQRVIDVTYESLNAVAAMQAEPNGIIPDFIRWDNVNDVWIVPNQGTGTHPNHTAGQQWHESSSDGARHWNACRVPWRLGVDVLFSGVTPVSETVTETYNAFQLAVTNGVFNQVAGRWLNGELNLTHEWGRNSYNAFWGPSAVLAFAHGPQAWADSAWNVVSNNTFMNNQFGDYISMLTSIAITGNEWTPVGSPLTVINGTGSAPRYVAGARVPIEANDGFLPFSHWVLDGAEFWEGSDQYDSRAYIVMPAGTAVTATAVFGALELNEPQRPFPQSGVTDFPVERTLPSAITSGPAHSRPEGLTIQEQMDLDVAIRFNNLIKNFSVDPCPETMDDPENFRMVLEMRRNSYVSPGWRGITVCEAQGYGMMLLVLMAGSEDMTVPDRWSPGGGGTGTGANSIPPLDSTIRRNLFENLPEGLQEAFGSYENVCIQTYFDAMFRTVRHFPSFEILDGGLLGPATEPWAHVGNVIRQGMEPVYGRRSYMMSWEIFSLGTTGLNALGTNRPTDPFFCGRIVDLSHSVAADGQLDIAMAILMASEQWGGGDFGGTLDQRESGHPNEHPVLYGNPVTVHDPDFGRNEEGYVSYHEWALGMINDIWITMVDLPTPLKAELGIEANFHLKVGNWATDGCAYFFCRGGCRGGIVGQQQVFANMMPAPQRWLHACGHDMLSDATRGSDHMLDHLRAFAAADTDNNWQLVIDATYDSLRQIALLQMDNPNPHANSNDYGLTGIINDFKLFDRETGQWRAAPNNMGGWLEGNRDATMSWNALRVPWRLGTHLMMSGATAIDYSVIRPLHDWTRATHPNFTTINSRQLNGNTGGGASGGPGFGWYTPYLITASVFGDQEWLTLGWNAARNQGAQDQYSSYFGVIAMIAASGNYWNPTDSNLRPSTGANLNVRFGEGSGVFAAGSSARIEPHSRPGYVFDRWVVATPDVAFTNGTSYRNSVAYITMPATGGVIVTALFVEATPELSLEVFNNGTCDQVPSLAGTIRIWPQLDGVNVMLPMSAEITALDQDGEDAMEFVTRSRQWTDAGWQDYYVNFDVAKAGASWQYITFTVTAFGQTVEVLLINNLFVPPAVVFDGTNPNRLRDLFAEASNIVLSTRGNLGIFEQHGTFVIPEGVTLTVTTAFNAQRNAEIRVEGTLIIADGGRLNGQAGGTIRVADGGTLIIHGIAENMATSTFINAGEIAVTGTGRLNIRADAYYCLEDGEFLEGAADIRNGARPLQS